MRSLPVVGLILAVSWSVAQAAETWGCVYQGEDGLYWVSEHTPALRLLPLKSQGPIYGAISPDGQRVALVTAGGSFMIHEISMGRTPVVCKGGGVGPFAWSPDSRMIAYVQKGGLRIIKPGGQIGLLAHVPDMTDMGWSPDGKWIAYGRMDQRNEDLGLWLISTRGGKARCLVPPIHDLFVAQDPQWSPDGKWIAFVYGYEGAVLELVRPDGSGRRKGVDKVGWFRWQPDSSALIYEAMEDEATARGLATCTPTGKPRLLRRTSPGVEFALLAKDRLLVINPNSYVKLVSIAGGRDRLLWFHALDHYTTAVIGSPDGETVALRPESAARNLCLISQAGELVTVASGIKRILGWTKSPPPPQGE